MLTAICLTIVYAALVVMFAVVFVTFPKILGMIDDTEETPTFVIALASCIWPITLIMLIIFIPFSMLVKFIDKVR